jgi:phosphatidylglycerophosphate synthase
MRLDVLRCKTPASVRQELWTGLLAYNLIRQSMLQSAHRTGDRPDRLSFTAAMQMLANTWLTAAVIGRDLIILAGGAVIFLIRGRREFPPTVFGKMSTVMQVATVFWVVLSNSVRVSTFGRSSLLAAVTSSSVLDGFYAATLLLTAVSGAHYIYKGIRMAFPGGATQP